MYRLRMAIAAPLLILGLSVGSAAAVQAPAAAAGFVTIYPNYGNHHCGPGGWVRAVQVSAFQGTTNVYRNQNWAPVGAVNGRSTQIVANVWCAYWYNKSGSAFKAVSNNVVARANQSYYF